MNKSNKVKVFICLVFILIIGFVISDRINNENEISENYSFAYGKIYRKTKNWTNRNCTANYYYQFHYNGKSYKGEDCGHNYFVVNEKLFCKIEFSTKNPNQNKLNFSDLYVKKLSRENEIDTIYEPISENKVLLDKTTEGVK